MTNAGNDFNLRLVLSDEVSHKDGIGPFVSQPREPFGIASAADKSDFNHEFNALSVLMTAVQCVSCDVKL